MATRHRLSPELVERFSSAVTALDQRFADDANVMIDENQDATVRGWLDEAGTLP